MASLYATGGSQRDAGGQGYLKGCRYVLHDRNEKFCAEFRDTLAAGSVICVVLPARSPNLNCYAALGGMLLAFWGSSLLVDFISSGQSA
jgi:hypothetical protein